MTCVNDSQSSHHNTYLVTLIIIQMIIYSVCCIEDIFSFSKTNFASFYDWLFFFSFVVLYISDIYISVTNETIDHITEYSTVQIADELHISFFPSCGRRISIKKNLIIFLMVYHKLISLVQLLHSSAFLQITSILFIFNKLYFSVTVSLLSLLNIKI